MLTSDARWRHGRKQPADTAERFTLTITVLTRGSARRPARETHCGYRAGHRVAKFKVR